MRRLPLLLLPLLIACGGDDGGSTVTGHWQMLTPTKQPSSLLAAWSSGMDNVWIVGGREGNAAGVPVIWHYDGAAWSKMDHGQSAVDFWQVFGVDDAVFIGASDGKIFRYRSGGFELMPTPKAGVIVFGLWGTSSSDVWATGGTFAGSAFVWHFDGTAWSDVPGVPADIAGAVWKVTGTSKDDVWMSASNSYVLHWDGQALSSEKIGLEDQLEKTLFSIGCSRTRCTTAGSNQSNGVLYDRVPGGTWKLGFDEGAPVWRGVTPVGDQAYVVGQFGAVVRWDGKAWVADSHMMTNETLHATWSDEQGNMFAVGGKFDRPITIDGVILFKGADDLPTLP
jgi:hypothetical protein